MPMLSVIRFSIPTHKELFREHLLVQKEQKFIK